MVWACIFLIWPDHKLHCAKPKIPKAQRWQRTRHTIFRLSILRLAYEIGLLQTPETSRNPQRADLKPNGSLPYVASKPSRSQNRLQGPCFPQATPCICFVALQTQKKNTHRGSLGKLVCTCLQCITWMCVFSGRKQKPARGTFRACQVYI